METDYKALWEYVNRKNSDLEKRNEELEASCAKLEAEIQEKDKQIDELTDTIADNACFTDYLTGQLIAYRNIINVIFGGKAK